MKTRNILGALATIGVALSVAQGIGAQSFIARPERLPAVGRSVVTVDDSLALRMNPANLGFMQGAELRWRGVLLRDDARAPWQGNAISLGVPLPFGLAVGAEFDMALPPVDIPFAPNTDYQWLTLGGAFGDHEKAAIGFSWQRSWSSNPYYDDFSSFSIGLSYRPWDVLGASFVAEQITGPRSRLGARINPLLHFAAAVRPFGTRSLELTIDGRYETDVDTWAPEAVLAIDMPFGQINATGAWLPNSKPGGNRQWAVTAGAALDVSGASGSMQVEASALMGNAWARQALAGGYASVAFRGWRTKTGLDFHYARRIRIESTPNARGHVALLRHLWALAKDPMCTAVVLEVRARPAASLARAEELRDAIGYLQQNGKPVLCHMEDAGGSALFVCSAATKSLINPAGGIRFAGLSSTYLYFKGLLDKLGIKAEFIRIGKHKSAPERFTRTGPTETAKRNSIELLYQFERGLVDGIAEGRGLDPAQVRKGINGGPYVASEAIAVDFVNGAAFDDQLGKELDEVMGGSTAIVDSPFAKQQPETFGVGRSLAVVYVDGDMVDGRSKTIPILGIKLAGSYTLADTLEQLRFSPTVGAVVLRIETPGGSAMAADVVWRQVELLAKVKPVIVSMGSVAASGGYYIAAPATEIYANPLTITGSIGIFYGKADIQGLMNKIGVDVTVYKTGPRADAESMFRPYTDDERRVLSEKVRQFYDVFIGRVAEGRDLSVADVDKVGQGRVWTGLQASQNGLVDHLGGLRQAMDKARKLGDLDDNAPVIQLPKIKTSLLGMLLGVEGIHASADLPAPFKAIGRALAPFAVHAGDKPWARLEVTEISP